MNVSPCVTTGICGSSGTGQRSLCRSVYRPRQSPSIDALIQNQVTGILAEVFGTGTHERSRAGPEPLVAETEDLVLFALRLKLVALAVGSEDLQVILRQRTRISVPHQTAAVITIYFNGEHLSAVDNLGIKAFQADVDLLVRQAPRQDSFS